jgi:large subunit ribosomal protein L5
VTEPRTKPTAEPKTDAATEPTTDAATEQAPEAMTESASAPTAKGAAESAEPTAEATKADAPDAEASSAESPATESPAAESPAEAEPDSKRPAASDRPSASDRPAGRRQAATPAREGRAAANGSAHRLRDRYKSDVVPALIKQFSYRNPMEVPRLTKIVVNIGLGEALTNAKAIDAAVGDLSMITGQKPIVTRATRSIAQFRLRAGNSVGAKVTLRGDRMWDFLDRLTSLALPRIRDFRGIPGRSFDGRGNYSLGFREQLAFPEIDYDKVDRLRGLEVSIVTTAKSDEESKRLLELLGMPFAG